MADFYIGENDRLPYIRATLSDENGVVNLTGATVKLRARKAGDSTPTLINQTCTVVIAAAGTVEYAWAAADTIVPGKYWLQWTVDYGAAGKMTIPNQGADELFINDFWGG